MDLSQLTDVASREIGATVMFANDDFFADAHNLINPEAPCHDVTTFGARGKVYDGWETRRRREPGHDFVVIRLAAPAVVRAVDVDTSFFTGNFPPIAAVDGIAVLGYPTVEELPDEEWFPLVRSLSLKGDSSNLADVDEPRDRLVTHVRLSIFPDGGVARLRVYGDVVPDPRHLGGRIDVAALTSGGRVDACSNMHYSSPANVLKPGYANVMSDGWETARRRDDGNDWLQVRLAANSVLHEVVVDTSRFVGNAPGWVQLTDAASGAQLLGKTRLLADTEHRFRLSGDAPPVSSVRLDVFPDGGLSRLRIIGSIVEDERERISARWMSLLPARERAKVEEGDWFA